MFYTNKKGGQFISHTEGGGTKNLDVVLTWYTIVFSHAEGGKGKEMSNTLKGVCEKFYPVSRWSAKSFGLAIFPFCSPTPLPVINYRSHINQPVVLHNGFQE